MLLKLPSWLTVKLIIELGTAGFNAAVIPTRGYLTLQIKSKPQRKLIWSK